MKPEAEAQVVATEIKVRLTLHGPLLCPEAKREKTEEERESSEHQASWGHKFVRGSSEVVGGSEALLTHMPTQVLEGIAHTAESGIDAHACLLGDLLEALLLPVAQAHDLLLLFGEETDTDA